MTNLRRKQIRNAGAISLAGIAAIAGTVRAADGMLFTRNEGRQLERRLDSVEENSREDMKEIRQSLQAIWMALPPQSRRREKPR